MMKSMPYTPTRFQPHSVPRSRIHWPGTSGQTWSFTQGLIADPAGLARKHQRWFPFQWQYGIKVPMHDLEARNVQHRAFEAGILVAADDERIQAFALHAVADILVTTVYFLSAWQSIFSGFIFTIPAGVALGRRTALPQ
jgi:hypothetical protein